jgi:hypothetical protein
VEVSRKSELPAEHSSLVGRWTERDFDVQTHVATASIEPWWFAGGRSPAEERSLTAAFVGATRDWLVSTLIPTGAA